ncbi:MAG: hypothetical protein QM692_05650 [Thermomicrobiales bacterium]
MTFSWNDFVELGDWLANARADEAAQRTAISRAYYAAYHAASAFVRTERLCPPDQNLTHWLVWRLIRTSQHPRGEKIAEIGFELRDLRVAADYWLQFPGDPYTKARDAISSSTVIVTMLSDS